MGHHEPGPISKFIGFNPVEMSGVACIIDDICPVLYGAVH